MPHTCSIESKIVSRNHYFVDVSIRKHWSQSDVENAGLPWRLSNDQFAQDIFQAYSDLGKRAALLYDNLQYYEYITYTVKEDNGDSTQIRIKVEDVVDVTEEQEGVAYARVKAIVLHKYNDDTFYPFFVFDWFSSTRSHHSILQCIIYLAQGQNDRWRHTHSPLLIIFRGFTFSMSVHVFVQSNSMI